MLFILAIVSSKSFLYGFLLAVYPRIRIHSSSLFSENINILVTDILIIELLTRILTIPV